MSRAFTTDPSRMEPGKPANFAAGIPGRPSGAPESDAYRKSARIDCGAWFRDRQGLDTELLLDLQRLKPCRGRFEIGIDERAYTGLERVGELRDEARLQVDPGLVRTEGSRRVDCCVDEGIDIGKRRGRAVVRRDIEPLQTEETAGGDATRTPVRPRGSGRPRSALSIDRLQAPFASWVTEVVTPATLPASIDAFRPRATSSKVSLGPAT